MSNLIRHIEKTAVRQLTGRVIGGLAFGLSLCLLTVGEVEAVSFSFTKVIDTNTPIPGGTGSFTLFGTPSFDNGNLAFQGFGNNNQQGIYTIIEGRLNRVADLNNLIAFAGPPSISGSNVAFRSVNEIYTNIGGTLNRLTGGNMISRFNPSISGSNVAFQEINTNGQTAIYINIGGTLNLVADTTTSIPEGSGNFTFFGNPPQEDPRLDGNNVAFLGTGANGQRGIYTNIEGTLNRVADTTTPIPGGNSNFRSFLRAPSISGNNVAFLGESTFGGRGIYISIGGTLFAIADNSTPIPGGSGNFRFNFEPISLDGSNVAFSLGTNSPFSPPSGTGIYTTLGDSLTNVIVSGDILDGKTLSTVAIGRESLSGNSIAFYAGFTDQSSAIYLATLVQESSQRVPESSSVLGLLNIVGVLLWWKLRKSIDPI